MSDDREWFQVVDQISATIVAKHAEAVDREGRFPAEAIAALGESGVLGLISAEQVGGRGRGLRQAALVVERLAQECASTATIVAMHLAATAIIEKHGSTAVRKEIAAGRHLSTLAFSEPGSRSQLWTPIGTARRVGDRVRLDGHKSWVTTAHHAKSYVWSSKPLAGEQPSTLWLVPSDTQGLRVTEDRFDGLGLRGNDSCPVVADDAFVPATAMLGQDGQGFQLVLEVILPLFDVLSAACSVGLMETATARAASHAAHAGFQHSFGKLADIGTVRAQIARMRTKTDMARALLLDTFDAVERVRTDATLRVLECKAAAGDTAAEVTDLAMRVCGGAAFRRDLGIERAFRDARAALVMGPTSDALYDLIGKSVCGLPLF